MYALIFKRFLAALLLFCFAVSARAQEAHFLYLQTENGQPFYVKLDNKLTSSSSAGYLILPNVNDGTYELVVGFPKNIADEESFSISVNNNTGFLIKNFGDRGWGLFNMQSLAILPGKNSQLPVAVNSEAAPLKTDAFSNMLASVVKDSSILRSPKPLQAKEQLKNDENSLPAVENRDIEKLLSKKDKDGIQLVYLDKTGLADDTVRVFIPAGSKDGISTAEKSGEVAYNAPAKVSDANRAEEKTQEEVTTQAYNVEKVKSHQDTAKFTITPTIVSSGADENTISSDTAKTYKDNSQLHNATEGKEVVTENQTSNPFIKVIEPATTKSDQNPDDTKNPKLDVLPKVVTSSTVNSDCKSFASNSDFLKLRSKMASANGRAQMIEAAKKAFRSKCFSTEQIRNLSYLFLTDEGKYMFFDAAYPYSSDSDQYYLLGTQLRDEYFINRFNAMIHK